MIMRGIAAILFAIAILMVVLMAGTNAIVDRLVDWRESANYASIAASQAEVAQEGTTQVQIWQENETIRHEKTMDTLLAITEVQEKGLTDRAEMHYDTIYWTSWQSLGHRVLTILLIIAGALWAVIGLSYWGKRNADF